MRDFSFIASPFHANPNPNEKSLILRMLSTENDNDDDNDDDNDNDNDNDDDDDDDNDVLCPFQQGIAVPTACKTINSSPSLSTTEDSVVTFDFRFDGRNHESRGQLGFDCPGRLGSRTDLPRMG